MYEFFVNGVSQGAASATANFTSTTLQDGDKITVDLIDGSGCAVTSPEIEMTVHAITVDDPKDEAACDSYILPPLTTGNYFYGTEWNGYTIICWYCYYQQPNDLCVCRNRYYP